MCEKPCGQTLEHLHPAHLPRRDAPRAAVQLSSLRIEGNDEMNDYPGLLSFIAAIREAAGDPTGKLMQDELVAHIAALRADAERYLWLKPNFRVMSPDMGGQHRYSPTGPVTRMRGPTLDAAIDAERSANVEQEQG